MAQQRIGRYRIIAEIASSSQGSVYRGFDPENDRFLAIKASTPT